MTAHEPQGPLVGLRVSKLAGGPVPHAAETLAGPDADNVPIDRPGGTQSTRLGGCTTVRALSSIGLLHGFEAAA